MGYTMSLYNKRLIVLTKVGQAQFSCLFGFVARIKKVSQHNYNIDVTSGLLSFYTHTLRNLSHQSFKPFL